MVKSFSYPKNKDELIENLEEIARRENLTFSDIILDGLEKYWLEHGDSQNPQTLITLFETGIEKAIPNLYAKPEAWEKFYSLVKKKEDYDRLDQKFNTALNIHNENLKRF